MSAEARDSSGARAAILDALRRAPRVEPPPAPGAGVLTAKRWSPEERVARLKKAMESVRTEFFESDEAGWPAALHAFAVAQGLRNLLYGATTETGKRLGSSWTGAPELIPYERSIDDPGWKKRLFHDIDCGFTATRGAIAETGTLVLWPSPEEPRLMSLVPPVHVALLYTDRIRNTLLETIVEERWADALPPNALLISGPSKTADIEQTLAYGVHGPKRLVVLMVRR